MPTLHGSRCFRVKRVRPSRSSMSLLNIPHCSFPQVLSSPTGSRSRPSPSTSMGRSIRENLCESGRWSGMSGRMAKPAPNTSYEPNLSNFFSYMDTEHTPIHLTDSHHVFQCQDDATVISTIEDPERLPHSGAPSSKQTAASRVPSMFGPSSLWKQMAGHVSGRTGLQETGAILDRESVAKAILVHSRKGRETEIKTLCIR